MRLQPNPWLVAPGQTYSRRPFWNVCRRNPKNYGGHEFLPNASRTDPKRFYSEEKAQAAADALNKAGTSQQDSAQVAGKDGAA